MFPQKINTESKFKIVVKSQGQPKALFEQSWNLGSFRVPDATHQLS